MLKLGSSHFQRSLGSMRRAILKGVKDNLVVFKQKISLSKPFVQKSYINYELPNWEFHLYKQMKRNESVKIEGHQTKYSSFSNCFRIP